MMHIRDKQEANAEGNLASIAHLPTLREKALSAVPPKSSDGHMVLIYNTGNLKKWRGGESGESSCTEGTRSEESLAQ